MRKRLTPKTIDAEWYAEVPRNTRLPTLTGFFLVLGATGAFGFWSSTAPISGAVIATGTFVATGQNKVIQHFEGGIVEEILVNEGDVVREGQTMIRLDETAPRANLRRLRLRLGRLEMMSARLKAEIEGRDKIPSVLEISDTIKGPEGASALEQQQLTFLTRRNRLLNDISILERSIAAYEQSVQGTDRQLEAAKQQVALLDEELGAKQQLLKKGLIRKPEILALRRVRADTEGDIGRMKAQIGDLQQRIARSQEEINRAKTVAVQGALEELHDVSAQIDDTREQIKAARDVLHRIDIDAPVDGIVVALRYHTQGGVIEAGKDIMEILPLQEERVIEVRIRPTDIDNVKVGQDAAVRLTALNRRVTPTIAGKVTYVSADAVRDNVTGEGDIYVARVELSPEEAARLPGFQATPGMPAEVYIKTVDRTFFEYLMQPIRDSMARAFRET